MDLNLDDDDEMILIVIGDDDENDGNNSLSNIYHKSEEPVKEMPFPVTIKVEPLEEDEVVSLNVENIIRTAAEHGHLVKIKQEEPDEYENTKEMKLNKGIYKHIRRKTNKKKTEAIKKYGKTKQSAMSFVEELRQSYPEFREDKKQLVTYLANLMRMTVPPEPPKDYYVIDIDGKFICSFCEAPTLTAGAAARHYQNRHGPRYLDCYACGADFWSKINLYKHEKRCSAPDAKIVLQARGQYLGRKGRGRPYMTSNKFKPRINLLDPITGEEKPTSPKKKFLCSFCSAEFVHIETWESHENIHNGLRPYKCHICPSAYPSKMGLKKHRLTHGDQEFVCDHCNKSFKLKVTLISHMNTHLPQRKYGCDLCPKRYAQKSALRVHVNRDHLNLPPPCACPQCPKRYPRMSHLKNHMLKEHGLKLMTRKMFYKHLPRMNLQEMKAAQVVFNKDLTTYSTIEDEVVDESCFDTANYLDIAEDDVENTGEQLVGQDIKPKTRTNQPPVFHIQLSAS